MCSKATLFASLSIIAVATITVGCEDFDTGGYQKEDDSHQKGLVSGEVLYEAEDRAAEYGCRKRSNHAGYTGKGFMDYGGNGTWIEWSNINAVKAGEYKLIFRYANRNGERQSAVMVNGKKVGTVKFGATGGWETWGTETVRVPLQRGYNTVRVMADTGSGGPNLDHLKVAIGEETVDSGRCVLVSENQTASLSCSRGEEIVSIDFASYGLPTGSCDPFTGMVDTGFAIDNTCHAANFDYKVEASCLGRSSCSVSASNRVFGDPCPGKRKKLAIVYTCGTNNGGDDKCPNDPNKTEPGECGCGVPEGTCGGGDADLGKMLEDCKKRFSAALPEIDQSQKDAFMGAHRAEAKNAVNAGAPGYQDEEAVALTISLARPILSSPDLNQFISEPDSNLDMVKCAVLAVALPAGLEEFASRGTEEGELVEELLDNQDLMKQMLVAGGPRFGKWGPAMQIYKNIQQASSRARSGLFQRLAVAVSLELTADFYLKTIDDPVGRYLFYEKSYLEGELIPQFKEMSAWEYRHIINDMSTNDDLSWMRQMLRNYRPDLITHPKDRYRFIAFQESENEIPQKPVTYDASLPYSWHQQVLANGGQCGAKSVTMGTLMRSFGIPTWGMQISGHAGISHWTPSGWTPNLGVSFERGFYREDPMGVNIYHTAHLFWHEAMSRSIPAEYEKARRLEWIGDILGEEKIDLLMAGKGGLFHALSLNKKRAIAEDYDLKVDLPFEPHIEDVALSESETQIVIGGDGVITIPAVAISDLSKYNDKIQLIRNEQGHALMHYRRLEGLSSFTYHVDVPRAGRYKLTADVVTINMEQSFLLTVNNAASPIRFELPYTVGVWETSAPVEVSLVAGQNLLSFSREMPPANNHNWYCNTHSDGYCGGVTIKHFTLSEVK